VSEEIVRIFEKGIDRALRPWTREERERVLRLVRQVIQNLRIKKISPEEAYLQLVGISYEYLVPLTPKDISNIRRILGIG
jgi:hypothetical protein